MKLTGSARGQNVINMCEKIGRDEMMTGRVDVGYQKIKLNFSSDVHDTPMTSL